METLAYLHLVLAHEASADTDCIDAISPIERSQLLIWLRWQKLSTSAAIHLLSLTVALGLLSVTSKASAALEQGTRGKQVIDIQQRLAQLGYFKENVTGYFGSVTKQAVIQFQQAKGLNPDGIVGEKTQASLSGSEQPISESPLEIAASESFVRAGDRGTQVVNIQQRLAAAGFSSGEKGVFDEATEDAVRQFQQAKGLKADGIVGSQTLAVLPTISDANPEAASQEPHSWYENKSTPLTPFTRRPD